MLCDVVSVFNMMRSCMAGTSSSSSLRSDSMARRTESVVRDDAEIGRAVSDPAAGV